MTLYAEALLNRRTTKVSSYRQFWTFQYVYDYSYFYGGTPGQQFGGDPVAISNGWTTDYGFFSPTAITDHSGSTTQVDYMRFVGGARGDLDFMGLNGWTWDASVQFSRSDGTTRPTSSGMMQSRPTSTRTRFAQTVRNPTTAYRGIPCVDINWYDPQFLAGNFTAAEKAFLFGTIKGNTVYEQTSFEGFALGSSSTAGGACRNGARL